MLHLPALADATTLARSCEPRVLSATIQAERVSEQTWVIMFVCLFVFVFVLFFFVLFFLFPIIKRLVKLQSTVAGIFLLLRYCHRSDQTSEARMFETKGNFAQFPWHSHFLSSFYSPTS